MPSGLLRSFTITMLIPGIILIPTITADAITDLQDLKTIINSAASRVGAPTDPGRNWGGFFGGSTQMGTADLVSNITTTVLRANFDLGLNQTKWINVTNITTTATPMPTVNLTETGIDDYYLDYVNTIPNLSTALVALGRSWHSEFNRPVYDAISALQATMTTFSTALLEANLIHAPSTIRTIRASGTLEDAQNAWSRILNLPGSSRSPSSSDGSSGSRRRGIVEASERNNLHARSDAELAGSLPAAVPASESNADAPTLVEITFQKAYRSAKRNFRPHRSLPVEDGRYSHKDLWGRKAEAEAEVKQWEENKPVMVQTKRPAAQKWRSRGR